MMVRSDDRGRVPVLLLLLRHVMMRRRRRRRRLLSVDGLFVRGRLLRTTRRAVVHDVGGLYGGRRDRVAADVRREMVQGGGRALVMVDGRRRRGIRTGRAVPHHLGRHDRRRRRTAVVRVMAARGHVTAAAAAHRASGHRYTGRRRRRRLMLLLLLLRDAAGRRRRAAARRFHLTCAHTHNRYDVMLIDRIVKKLYRKMLS